MPADGRELGTGVQCWWVATQHVRELEEDVAMVLRLLDHFGAVVGLFLG
jgi:hypothetical protein